MSLVFSVRMFVGFFTCGITGWYMFLRWVFWGNTLQHQGPLTTGSVVLSGGRFGTGIKSGQKVFKRFSGQLLAVVSVIF